MASPKAKKREILPRREPAAFDTAVRRHNATVGCLMWHWNRLHAIFAEAFTKTVTPNDSRLGLSVWHAIVADSGQRDMLEAAVQYTEAGHVGLAPRAFEAIEWLLAVVKKLSKFRNDAAHTPMSQGLDFEAHEFVVVPEPMMSKPQSAIRLGQPQLRKFHALLQGDLIQLYHYGKRALEEMDYPGHGAWPKTPSVQSLQRGEVPLTRSQKDRHQKRLQRLARLKASQVRRPNKSTAQRRAAAGWKRP